MLDVIEVTEPLPRISGDDTDYEDMLIQGMFEGGLDEVSMASLRNVERAAGVFAKLEGNTPQSLHDRVDDSTNPSDVLASILLKLFDDPETIRGVTRNVTAGLSDLSGTPGPSEPVESSPNRSGDPQPCRGRIPSTRKRFEELASTQAE